jgi:hypothetical protein
MRPWQLQARPAGCQAASQAAEMYESHMVVAPLCRTVQCISLQADELL